MNKTQLISNKQKDLSAPKMKVTSISLSAEKFHLLKDYCFLTNQTLSNLILNSIDWTLIEEELSNGG